VKVGGESRKRVKSAEATLRSSVEKLVEKGGNILNPPLSRGFKRKSGGKGC